jgi:hypothetical protein
MSDNTTDNEANELNKIPLKTPAPEGQSPGVNFSWNSCANQESPYGDKFFNSKQQLK